MSRKVIYLMILLLVFAAGGSCSRHSSPGYHGPNRVRSKPHKEWKQPKSRYKRLSDEGTERQRDEGKKRLRDEGMKALGREGMRYLVNGQAVIFCSVS